MKKALSILVTVVMLSALILSGCGGAAQKGSETTQASVETTAAQTTSAAAEPATVDLMTFALIQKQDVNDLWIWKGIEEKTNVRIKCTTYDSSTYDEKLNTVIASGNMPDLMSMPVPDGANKFGTQGAILDIKQYFDKMPNLAGWIKQFPEIYTDYLSADGKMYAFPAGGSGETGRRGWLYRKDVFTKNNLKAPDSFDELYQDLKQLKTIYPDSYPLVFRSGLANLRIPAPQWGTSFLEILYYDYDKKEWRFGPTEDNFKEMIKFFNKLYVEKLIPPDWLTINTDQWVDMISTGKAFVTFDYASRLDFFNLPMQEKNAEFQLAYMNPPVSPVNDSRLMPYTFQESYTTSVSSTTKKLDAVLKVMDWMFSEEGRDTVSWGKEGETYTVVDGKKKFPSELKTMGDIQNKFGIFLANSYAWFDYDSIMSVFSPELTEAVVEGKKHDAKPIPIVAFTENESNELGTLADTIKKASDEQLTKFILGTRSIDEWDKYVEEINQLNVKRLIELYTTGYGRQLKNAQAQ